MPDYHYPVCSCGSLRFNQRLIMFPMTFTATCAKCQRPAVVCTIKPTLKRKWIEGAFDQYNIWRPGHFE